MSVFFHLRLLGERLFRGSQAENEMQEELESHVQLRADPLERGGLWLREEN